MASRNLDWPLLLLSLLLTLHLLSFSFHFLRKSNHRRLGLTRRMLPLFSIPVLLSALFALSDLESPKNNGLMFELEEMKLRIAGLESSQEEMMKTFNSKTLHLDESNKLIDEMERRIQFLQNELGKMKTSLGSSSYFEEMLKAMEEELRLLWAESRKNNFNIHILESKAYEEEKIVQTVASEVEKMENIVTEQWIQIRQLEQALQTMKMMKSNVHKKSKTNMHKKKPNKCTMLKFMKGIRRHYITEVASDSVFWGGSSSNSFISRAFDDIKRIKSAAKEWHHELQDSVKLALEKNEFTAPIANQEVIFLVASAIAMIPILSALIILEVFFRVARLTAGYTSF